MQQEYLTFSFATYEVRIPGLFAIFLLVFIFVGEHFDKFPVSIIHDEVFDGTSVGFEWRDVVDVQDLYV